MSKQLPPILYIQPLVESTADFEVSTTDTPKPPRVEEGTEIGGSLHRSPAVTDLRSLAQPHCQVAAEEALVIPANNSNDGASSSQGAASSSSSIN